MRKDDGSKSSGLVSIGPGKTVLMLDARAKASPSDEPALEFLKQDDGDESPGFDPYDTATLYKK